MKLIVKITLFYILISSLVFLVGGVITYSVMIREIQLEQQWFLQERLPFAIHYVKKKHPDHVLIGDKMIITPLPSAVNETEPVFSDTLVMHNTLQRLEPHDKLDVIKRIDGRYYQITLYDLIVESDDIEDIVEEAMIKIYGLLLTSILILAFVGSFFVFKPFQATLAAIRNFSLQDSGPILLPDSSTSEFKKLNQFIKEMTEKVKKDYVSLKEFSENASHEMQTPLSIAQGKLELLMTSENLTEEQIELIISAGQAIGRLSKLSHSLSLLTKIENREFSEMTEVNLSEMLNRFLFDFRELMDMKSIKLEALVEPEVQVLGNVNLIEIMLTNLLNNAIRHNIKNGRIEVKLDKEKHKIGNSGLPLKVDPEDLFKRFKKDNDHPGSSGLGLSIIKSICEAHHFDISYAYNDGFHELIIRFNRQ